MKQTTEVLYILPEIDEELLKESINYHRAKCNKLRPLVLANNKLMSFNLEHDKDDLLTITYLKYIYNNINDDMEYQREMKKYIYEILECIINKFSKDKLYEIRRYIYSRLDKAEKIIKGYPIRVKGWKRTNFKTLGPNENEFRCLYMISNKRLSEIVKYIDKDLENI